MARTFSFEAKVSGKFEFDVSAGRFPEKATSYRGLQIERTASKSLSYYQCIVEAKLIFKRRRQEFNKLGKINDAENGKSHAFETAVTYNPVLNEMTIPAGILQPPFYSPDADDAMNFGGIRRSYR